MTISYMLLLFGIAVAAGGFAAGAFGLLGICGSPPMQARDFALAGGCAVVMVMLIVVERLQPRSSVFRQENAPAAPTADELAEPPK